jgi:cell division septation protein DedD
MKKIWILSIGLFLAATNRAHAQEQVSLQEFAITPAVGQFTICAASFTGETAPKEAYDLAMEIRNRYRLAAYVFNRGAELKRQQDEELERKRKQQQAYLQKMGLNPDIPLRLKRYHIEEQFAVLIGGFKDMDAARHELSRIKSLEPPKSVASMRVSVEIDPKSKESKLYKPGNYEFNPFVNSFVVHNPSISVDVDNSKPDPFWKQLNSGEDYSLLKCKKPWTLVIKEYQTTPVYESQKEKSAFFSKVFGNLTQQLDANAQNAHNLAEGLRRMGFKAYVLHTRCTSIVTIGEFEKQNDPQMETVTRALSSNVKLDPKLDLFVKPIPMPVPRFDS